LQVIVPRPGVAAKVEIGLVGSGDIEGMLVQSDGRGFEGLDIELVDQSGKVVASARSDYDGFFLFDRIPYGRYSLRLTADSAHAAGVHSAIDRAIEISAQKSVVRTGAIRILKAPQLALSASGGGSVVASPH